MAEEQLYTVEGAKATPAERVSLTEAGLLERQHLQEWVIAHPEILGEDVLFVTFESDRWITGGGAPTWERLDVLALDRAGRLIVTELKRDVAPDAVMVQALNASRRRPERACGTSRRHRVTQLGGRHPLPVVERRPPLAPSRKPHPTC